MLSKFKRVLTPILFSLFMLLSMPAKADISFPARLEIVEISPGVFQVTFILPVVNGKVLKASPVLPKVCEQTSTINTEGNANIKKQTWQISCNSKNLSGETFGIDGLQGSQVDILLNINFLDGRNYTSKLSPAYAYYSIPKPLSWFALLQKAIVKGMRIPLGEIGLYALIFAALFLEKRKKNILIAGVLFVIAQALGQILSLELLLEVPSFGLSWLSLFFATIAFLQLQKNKPLLVSVRVLYGIALLIGIYLGANHADKNLTPGLTFQESYLYQFFITLGIAAGTYLAYALLTSFLDLVSVFKPNKTEKELVKTFSFYLAIFTLGFLLYQSTLFWTFPSLIPKIPFIALLFVFVLAIWLGNSTPKKSLLFVWSFCLALAIGMFLGFQHIVFIESYLVLLGAIFYMLLQLAFKKDGTPVLNSVFIAIPSCFLGMYIANYATNNLSYAIGQTLNFYLLLVTFFFLIYLAFGNKTLETFSNQKRNILVIIIAIVILFLGVAFFKENYYSNWISAKAMGLLTLPIISILLAIIALLVWPRYKKVHKVLKVKKRAPLTSVMLLVLAFLFLPVTLKINNPWYQSKTPEKEEVSRIMQQLLSNTYKAFNLSDETKLFEELSENVDKDLIDNIYLDSRRRFNIGLKEGSEVWIKDIEVMNIGDVTTTDQQENRYEYDTEWVVTARVKHLQHIHYRQNKYTGNIEIKTEDQKWKITKITLSSEDRKVIAAASR